MAIYLFFFPRGGDFEENFFPQKNSKLLLTNIFSESSLRFFAGVQVQSASPKRFKRFSERKKSWNFGRRSDFCKFPPIEKISDWVRDQKYFHPYARSSRSKGGLDGSNISRIKRSRTICKPQSFDWHPSLSDDIKCENMKSQNFWGLLEDLPGQRKFELKFWKAISRRILMRQLCELGYWSEKGKFLEFLMRYGGLNKLHEQEDEKNSSLSL